MVLSLVMKCVGYRSFGKGWIVRTPAFLTTMVFLPLCSLLFSYLGLSYLPHHVCLSLLYFSIFSSAGILWGWEHKRWVLVGKFSQDKANQGKSRQHTTQDNTTQQKTRQLKTTQDHINNTRKDNTAHNTTQCKIAHKTTQHTTQHIKLQDKTRTRRDILILPFRVLLFSRLPVL
jgi:hypothetical protein